MIRKNIFYIALFALSLLANIFFIYASLTKDLPFIDQESIIIESMISKGRYETFAESCAVNQYEECTESNGTRVSLTSLFDDPKQIYLLISDNTCNSCINECLEVLSEIIQEFDPNRVIILGSFDNKRSFFLLQREYPFRFFLLEENSALNKISSSGQNPLFFTVEYPNKLRNAFSSLSRYNMLTRSYLDSVLQIINGN